MKHWLIAAVMAAGVAIYTVYIGFCFYYAGRADGIEWAKNVVFPPKECWFQGLPCPPVSEGK